MKSIIILLFIIGVSMVLVGYTRQYSICPNPRIEYRYIPRTFYDEQLSNENVLKQFSSMFEDTNPWIKDRNIKKTETIDKKNFFQSLNQ
jgi:hypothetical protein